MHFMVSRTAKSENVYVRQGRMRRQRRVFCFLGLMIPSNTAFQELGACGKGGGSVCFGLAGGFCLRISEQHPRHVSTNSRLFGIPICVSCKALVWIPGVLKCPSGCTCCVWGRIGVCACAPQWPSVFGARVIGNQTSQCSRLSFE